MNSYHLHLRSISLYGMVKVSLFDACMLAVSFDIKMDFIGQ